MAKRGETLVHASDTHGHTGLADVFDLDAQSFRAWVVDCLAAQSVGAHLPAEKGLHPSGEVGYVAFTVIAPPSQSPSPPSPIAAPDPERRSPKKR